MRKYQINGQEVVLIDGELYKKIQDVAESSGGGRKIR